MKKRVLPCLSVLSVFWLLAACVPGLSDDAGLYFGHSSGSIPLSKGQMTEAHIRDTLPRYLGIIEEVVIESGSVLGVSGKNQIDDYATKDTADMDIHWIMMVTPAIDYKDLRRTVVERVQRNGFGYSQDPVRRDKFNSHTVTVGDEYGNKLSLCHREIRDGIIIDLYSECVFPSQPPDPGTPRQSYPLPSLEKTFPNLTIVQVFDDNGGENPELCPQSGTQSEGRV